MTEGKRRTGRPIKEAVPGTRISLGLKVTPGAKHRLDTAARANGRTQSQEAEARLEQSFRNEDLLPQVLDLAYGRQAAGLLMLIGRCIALTKQTGIISVSDLVEIAEGWMNQPWAAFQVADAIRYLLYRLCPENRPDPPETLAKTMEYLSDEVRTGLEQAGQAIAHGLLKILIDPSSHHALGPATQVIRERLAEVVEKLGDEGHAR